MKTYNELMIKKQSRMALCIVALSGLVLAGCSDDKASDQNGKAEVAVAEATEAVTEFVTEKADIIAVPAKETTEIDAAVVTPESSFEPVVEEAKPESAKPEASTSVSGVKPEPMVGAPTTENKDAQTNAAEPKTHTVKAAVTKFLPMVLFINPGDTVTWTNMAGHDTSSLEGMIPEGAEAWQSKMGEVFSVTFNKEGAYVYKCTPHVSLGMLGAIIVGDDEPVNLEQITGHPENKGMIKRAIRKMTQALDKR